MAPKRKKSASRKAGAKGKGKGKGKKIPSPSPTEKPDHPEDIYPMVLTTATQELFKCSIDEDVTKESPYKLLNKDDIIQDIKTRVAVSDFHPVKQIVLDYPEDEMLLVFDVDFTYGNCFYLVITPEAKDRILNPPQPEITEALEDDVIKTPEPTPWISLGSEMEVDEESVKETREKLCYKFSKTRRMFGTPVSFSDRNSADAVGGYLECASYQDSRFSITQMQRDCGIQAVSMLQSSSTQTQWGFQRNIFTQYEPRVLSEEEREIILSSENLKTFCNSVTPRVLHALQQENIMNVFTDEFKVLGIGAEASDRLVKVSEGLELQQAFTDHKHTKGKNISCVNWHPTIYGLIAVASTKKKEQLNEPTVNIIGSAFIVFYSFSDQSNPRLLLECPDDIFAFEFCPTNPNIIVGGCTNGQVVLWDISIHVPLLQDTLPKLTEDSDSDADTFDFDDNKENKIPVMRYCAISAIESSHKSPVTDVQWLPKTFEVTRTGIPVQNNSKISVQVVTCSPDCTVMFWDLRLPILQNQFVAKKKQDVDQKTVMTPYSIPKTFKHLDRTWKPLFKVSLPKIDTNGEYVPLKFSLEHYTGNSNTVNENDGTEVLPEYGQLKRPSSKTLRTLNDVNTKLYIGTEEGEIVYTDWKLETDEFLRKFSAKPLFCFRSHAWCVNSIQRSPFFKDIVLTMGGWNFAIWKEGAMGGPIFMGPSSEQQYTAGCWSLSRPAVFFMGRGDGSIEVWNLLLNTSEPAHVYAHVVSTRITCIKPCIASSKQHYLAVADNLGMLRVFKMPKALYTPFRNENLKVQNYFDREHDRLEDYLEREEQWAKQKKEPGRFKKQAEPEKPVKFQEDSEETEKKEYNDYLTLEENILMSMGLSSHTANTQNR